MGEWRKPRDQQQQEFLSPHLFLPLIPPFRSLYLLLCVHVNCAQWRADHGADNDARNARTTRQEARPQIKYIKKGKRMKLFKNVLPLCLASRLVNERRQRAPRKKRADLWKNA
ncbi:hypothetical protein NPIL_395011 [Nephila pilipes]|uniref:Uncharacterized protein n=1 Tax=Nephila pilipes TaxID=299642 RepID=A0A8X6NCE6_NEPPI|nr:hypothetical protein NPIL_395011 [Nephila pilipes]